MENQELIARDTQCVMQTYGRFPIAIDHGQCTYGTGPLPIAVTQAVNADASRKVHILPALHIVQPVSYTHLVRCGQSDPARNAGAAGTASAARRTAGVVLRKTDLLSLRPSAANGSAGRDSDG